MACRMGWAIEQVSGEVDLGVEVVGGAVTAEAAAAVEDSCVDEEEAGGGR